MAVPEVTEKQEEGFKTFFAEPNETRTLGEILVKIYDTELGLPEA